MISPKLPRAPKARGELAEARFIAKALSLGYAVAKPFGDSQPYDFIVHAGGRLSRVQVKSAWRPTPREAFQFVASPIQIRGHRAHPYHGDEIDFFVAYIAPADAWFVIPIHALLRHNHLHLSLDSQHPFARYREAWHLLEQVSIQACRELPVIEWLVPAPELGGRDGAGLRNTSGIRSEAIAVIDASALPTRRS